MNFYSFEGNFKSKRGINLSGNKSTLNKDDIRTERLRREQERQRTINVVKIQARYRGYWCRSKLRKEFKAGNVDDITIIRAAVLLNDYELLMRSDLSKLPKDFGLSKQLAQLCMSYFCEPMVSVEDKEKLFTRARAVLHVGGSECFIRVVNAKFHVDFFVELILKRETDPEFVVLNILTMPLMSSGIVLSNTRLGDTVRGLDTEHISKLINRAQAETILVNFLASGIYSDKFVHLIFLLVDFPADGATNGGNDADQYDEDDDDYQVRAQDRIIFGSKDLALKSSNISNLDLVYLFLLCVMFKRRKYEILPNLLKRITPEEMVKRIRTNAVAYSKIEECLLVLVSDLFVLQLLITDKSLLSRDFMISYTTIVHPIVLTFFNGRCSGLINNCIDSLTNCLKRIYEYDYESRFMPVSFVWDVYTLSSVHELPNLLLLEESDLKKTTFAPFIRDVEVIRKAPFLVSFDQRVKIFRRVCNLDSFKYHKRFPPMVIHRALIFEDGFDHLMRLGKDIKNRLQITFVSELGYEEEGVDGGGVFKEFITSLLKDIFDKGLFAETSDRLLYPSPESNSPLKYFYFLGLVIGRALYSGVLLDQGFAGFFLSKLLGENRDVESLDELKKVDPELYKNLVFLRTYNGDVSDLGLSFTLDTKNQTIELCPRGSEIPVTNENKFRYIHAVAKYKLSIQLKPQVNAFIEGFRQVIDVDWIRMFNKEELHILISGAEVDVDLVDLKDNTVYSGVYDKDHPTIIAFWNTMEELNNEDRRTVVKFVTSCSRPPILGFKELNPKLCIRDSGNDEERLPTASTCVNLLKLPIYKSQHVLKSKLLTAVKSGAGFDFS